MCRAGSTNCRLLGIAFACRLICLARIVNFAIFCEVVSADAYTRVRCLRPPRLLCSTPVHVFAPPLVRNRLRVLAAVPFSAPNAYPVVIALHNAVLRRPLLSATLASDHFFRLPTSAKLNFSALIKVACCWLRIRCVNVQHLTLTQPAAGPGPVISALISDSDMAAVVLREVMPV